jgi:cystathionine beta-lyase
MFDVIHDRKNSRSLKYDGIQKRFNRNEVDLHPMWVADMDFLCDENIRESLNKRVSHGIFGYGCASDEIYLALTNWMRSRHQTDILDKAVTYVPGVVTALNLLVRTMTDEEDKILIQTPVYPHFMNAITNNNRIVVENPLILKGDSYKIDFSDLEEKFKLGIKLFILCSPHNPVGRVWKEQELIKVFELCSKYNVKVVSDEIHMDLTYKGHSHTSLIKIDECLKTDYAVCVSPSKTFNVAGLQISFVLSRNEEVVEALKREMTRTGISEKPNVFGIEAVIAAYDNSGPWLDDALEYIEGNYNFLCKYVEKNMMKLKVIKSEGTYLVWISFEETGITDGTIEDFLFEKAKVLLNCGYSYGDAGRGFVRMNIACPRESVEKGLVRLKEALELVN